MSVTYGKEFDGSDIGQAIEVGGMCMLVTEDYSRIDQWLSDANATALEKSFVHQVLETANGRFAALEALSVEDEHRRKGYASQFINDCFLDEASDCAVQAVMLDTGHKQDGLYSLVAFYEQFGFEVMDLSVNDYQIMFRQP